MAGKIELLKRRRDDNGSLCYHFFQCSIRCPNINIFSIFIHNHSSFVHILPFNLHKIMFIFWMSLMFSLFSPDTSSSGSVACSAVFLLRVLYTSVRKTILVSENIQHTFSYKSSSMNSYTLTIAFFLQIAVILIGFKKYMYIKY